MKKISIFLMLCLAFFGMANAQTLNEGFEGTTFPPTDWTTIHVSGTNAWARSTGTGAGSSSAFAYRKDVNGGYEDYLITPQLEPKSGEELSFYLASAYASSYANTTLTIKVSTTTPEIASFTTDLASWTSGSSGNFGTTGSSDWVEKTVDVSAYVGQKIYIAFHAKDPGYNADVRIDNVSGVSLYVPACAKPTNLAVNLNEVGSALQAVVTWDGTAANDFIVTVNGTPVPGQTSPYTFNTTLGTAYEVVVEADCGAAGTSDPVSTNFTTPTCLPSEATIINYTLTDSYGDGWNGNAIYVIEGCLDNGTIVDALTIESGSTTSGTLELCGDSYLFVWYKGSYPTETSWEFTDAGGNTLFSGAGTSSMATGDNLYTIGTPIPTNLANGTPDKTTVELSWTENGTARTWEICVNGDETNLIEAKANPYILGSETALTPDTDYTVKVRAIDGTPSCWSDEISFTTATACERPTSLTQTNITTTSAQLSWSGNSDKYVVEYRPWYQVGVDQLSTEEFVTYNYDLSAYTGQGSIAIRHYDVTDVFYLNVDNVALDAANGTNIFTEGFESGAIPSTWSNYDVDGDGYTWDLAQTGSMNVIGNYGVYSASWISGAGALTPDNWLIIPDVQLGGTFSFAARGQDPNFPAENFAVYVSLNADAHETEPMTATSYTAENLIPGTPYAWQVKGICGTDESRYVTSLFKTVDDLLIFATDGYWFDLANWTDVDGNAATALPTADKKVRVDANAIIRSGEVATAGKTTINTGSIKVEDGGQLKHNSATLWVTMEKHILGYGAGNEEARDHYYFISTPFSGSTEIEQDGTWSHVNNLASGTYDLYAFDPTADLEWINYKESPTHSEFTAGNNNGLVFKKGYLYASEEERFVSFTGSIAKSIENSMSDTYTFDGTSTGEFNGLRLIGNPFSCSTYLTYVDASNNALQADYYVMDGDGKNFELASSNFALAPLTGAIINYGATGTINFSTEAPTTSKSSALTLNVTNSRGKVDMARVRFGEGFNLRKMSFMDNSMLYMTEDNKDYAVVYADNQGEMPVNFKASENGTYTISFNTENVEFGYLHLIDNKTGNDVDLLKTPSYTFNANATDYASRFRIVFNATGINEYSDEFAFISNGQIILNGQGTVQVYDITGRMINSYNEVTTIATDGMASGIYMLRLINGNDIKTQKIVVK